MQKQTRITSRIILLGLISTAICTLAIILANKLGNFKVDYSFLIIAVFISFVCIFATLYYFYYFDIAKIISSLSEKIREKFLSKDIPQKHNQLEDFDTLDELEKRVDMLIESRQKELEHVENLDSYRKEYLGNVSHELKTPVFNIQGYVDTLLNGGLEDPSINKEYLQRAEKSIDRLINIIDDLETITQLESGGMQLDIDEFDIAALCRDIYSSLELNASKKKY